MSDIGTLVYDATLRGDWQLVATNPRAQFGTAQRQFIGPTILPERTVEQNAYTEDGVRWRRVVANAGGRYSPSQRKGGAVVGTIDVRTGNSDIKRDLSGRAFDTLRRLLQRGGDEQALAAATNWVDETVNGALLDFNEVQRWQALAGGTITRRGDNGYVETVTMPNFTGMRSAAAGTWSTDTYDPMADIFGLAKRMIARGYTPGAIYMTTPDVMILTANAKVQARIGGFAVNSTGQIQGQPGYVTIDRLNGFMRANQLPPITTYDLQYFTNTGSQYFLPRGTLVMTAATGRNEQIDLGDGRFQILENVLGYVAVGVGVGQDAPGRVIRVDYDPEKPPRLMAEGWQESIAVIAEPDGVGAITGIA